MELLYGVILCIIGAANAMENESSSVVHQLTAATLADSDRDSNEAHHNDRHHYDAVTVNKPVMRHHPAEEEQLVEEEVEGDVAMGRRQYFDDEITGAPPAAMTPSVRCFCNMPACVATGYMCKSQYGGCFSDLHQHPPAASGGAKAVYRGRHGCVEMLTDKAQRERCRRLPNGNRYPASRNGGATRFRPNDYDHPRSLVHCCHEDMCNHADNPQTKDLINDTILGDSPDETRVIGSHMDPGYSDSDVWFKAATIAVPICGAVILFVLIAMAIRLLKTESLNNTNYKLGCTYVHGKHGGNNCKHHDAHYCRAEPFLRKSSPTAAGVHQQLQHPRVDLYAPTRRSLPAPIILTKNINERLNASAGSCKPPHYLLPQKHSKCYDNKNLSAFAGTIEEKPNNLSSSTAATTPLLPPATMADASSCDYNVKE